MTEPPRVLPERNEGVLHDLDHDLGIVATTEQPDVQPGAMPLVQLAQGARFPVRDRGDQRLVSHGRAGHDLTVAATTRFGSR